MNTLFTPAHLIMFAVLVGLFFYVQNHKKLKFAVALLILGIYTWGCGYKPPSQRAAAARPATTPAVVSKPTHPPRVVPGGTDWLALVPPATRKILEANPGPTFTPTVKVPYVPAEKCGGMSSWDRQFLNEGQPVPCPSPAELRR
jgi:hypothetical protein